MVSHREKLAISLLQFKNSSFGAKMASDKGFRRHYTHQRRKHKLNLGFKGLVEARVEIGLR